MRLGTVNFSVSMVVLAMILLMIGAPSAGAAASVSYQDSFGRAMSSGWGRADTGGLWKSATSSKLSVVSGRGVMELTRGHTAVAQLGGSGSADMDVTVDVSADQAPSGGGQYFSLVARGDQQTGYRLTARNRPNGNVEVTLRRQVNGTSTVLAGVRLQDVMSGGAQMRMRLQVQGSAPAQLRAKVWTQGKAEPTQWAVSSTDSSGSVPLSNSVALVSYLSSSSTDKSVQFRYDDFRVSSEAPAGDQVSPPPATGSSKPDAASTGVPSGTELKVLKRDNRPYSADTIYSDGSTLIINTPNAVYDRWRFDMFVEVRAPGVRITRSHFRGFSRTTYSRGLLTISNKTTAAGRPSVFVEDSTLIPSSPSNLLDGVRGSNATLRRVEISKVVDGVRIFGTTSYNDAHAGNVTVDRSWIHDLPYFDDGSHANGTHNDGIQIMGGHNIRITGSRIDGSISNAGLMITHGRNDVADVTFSGNWAAGGACTVNVADGDAGGVIERLTMDDNVFTRSSTRIRDCAMLVTSGTRSTARAANNVWHDGSSPAPTMKNGG